MRFGGTREILVLIKEEWVERHIGDKGNQQAHGTGNATISCHKENFD